MAVDNKIEDSFSDDSLEVSKDKNAKKIQRKVKKVYMRKRNLTYIELYRNRLVSESLKCDSEVSVSANEDSLQYPSGSSSAQDVQKVMIEENIAEANQKNINKSGKVSTNLWSEFLSRKYKILHNDSVENRKAQMLKKRLEYGHRMNTLNKFNKLCQTINEKNESNNKDLAVKCHQIALKHFVSATATKSYMKTNSKTLKQKRVSSKEVLNGEKEIQLKLEHLKIRYQKDKKIVDSIRSDVIKGIFNVESKII